MKATERYGRQAGAFASGSGSWAAVVGAVLLAYGVWDGAFRSGGAERLWAVVLGLALAALAFAARRLEAGGRRALERPESAAAEGEERPALGRIRELFCAEATARRLEGASLGVAAAGGEAASGAFSEFVPWGERVFDVALGEVAVEGQEASLLALAAKCGVQHAVAALLAECEAGGGAPEFQRMAGELRRRLGARRGAALALCYVRFDVEAQRVSWSASGGAALLHWQAASGRARLLEGPSCGEGVASCAPGDLFVIVPGGAAGLAEAVEACSALPAPDCAQRLCGRSGAGRLCACVRIERRAGGSVKGRWRIECPVRLEALKRFRREVLEVYAAPEVAAAFGAEEAERMALSLHEVLVNVIDHALPEEAGQAGSAVRLEAELFDDRIEWTFAHGMAFFAPTHVPVPNDDGSQNHGYGLYIIERSADRVRYFRNERGESCVKLVKWVCPGHEARGASGEGR